MAPQGAIFYMRALNNNFATSHRSSIASISDGVHKSFKKSFISFSEFKFFRLIDLDYSLEAKFNR